ncbi:signal peptidase I [Candidatus Woesearchaeota archaeon]|nr:signal peptidase I [Candidatus Woesearchaeota archaeon]
MNKKETKKILKKIWYFIWEDNSIWSWLVNILLAFILIKFIVYPGLGFVLSTTHPIVAVMSGSMEHEGSFDDWWNSETTVCAGNKECPQAEFYLMYNISKDDFKSYKFKNGFNTADIMVVYGTENIELGDVVVYQTKNPVPVIHRVINKWEENGEYFVTTKGDHNAGINFNERNLDSDYIIGKAVFRVPYLGWIKLGFVKIMNSFGVTVR